MSLEMKHVLSSRPQCIFCSKIQNFKVFDQLFETFLDHLKVTLKQQYFAPQFGICISEFQITVYFQLENSNFRTLFLTRTNKHIKETKLQGFCSPFLFSFSSFPPIQIYCIEKKVFILKIGSFINSLGFRSSLNSEQRTDGRIFSKNLSEE